MKKCFKQFLVSFLCLVIVLVSIVPIQAVEPTSVVDSESSDDEKVYCNATINDLFAEDCVIVVLNSELGGDKQNSSC